MAPRAVGSVSQALQSRASKANPAPQNMGVGVEAGSGGGGSDPWGQGNSGHLLV